MAGRWRRTRDTQTLVEQLNFKGAKGVGSPCEEERRWEDDENRMLLTHGEERKYRELAAKINYLAQDRVDIQYTTKEVCRCMCNPTTGDLKKLRRLGRYLINVPRVILSTAGKLDKIKFMDTLNQTLQGAATLRSRPMEAS